MISNSLISIIIPTFNRRAEVMAAVQSILSQPDDGCEIVIMDDGSTDATGNLLKSIKKDRVKYFYQENAGVSAARNIGAEHAKGEYLIFLDSDDRLLPGYLERVRSAIHDLPDIVFIGSVIKTEGKPLKIIDPTMPYGRPSKDGLFLAGSFVVKRSIFREAGGYDESITYGENTELSFRLQPFLTSRSFIEEGLLEINQAANRISVSPFNIRKSIGHMLVRHSDFLKSRPDILFLYLSNIGVACQRINLAFEAKSYFYRAWKLRPYHWKAVIRLSVSLLPPWFRKLVYKIK